MKKNVITAQRYFFALEILDQQTFNQPPFNPVLLLSVLRIHEYKIEAAKYRYNSIDSIDTFLVFFM